MKHETNGVTMLSLKFNIAILTGLVWLSFLYCDSASFAQSQSDWWERAAESRSKYYNIKTDLPPDEATAISDHMDRTYESYANLFAGLKLRRIARLDVYIFAQQKDYMAILRQKFNSDGTGSGGKCITRGNVISLVAWKGRTSTKQLQGVLQHEGFHQFASNFFPRLPTWANEGLAEIFQRGVLVGDRIVLGQVSRFDVTRLRKAKQSGQFRSVRDILTIKQAQWNHQLASGNAGANYLQAWCMVHCFLYAENGRYQSQFMDFLRGINDGVAWEKAFVTAFGIPDFSSMDEVWLRYVSTLAPMDFEETIRRLEFMATGYAQLREQEIYPTTLDELKNQLDEIKFEHESDLFGKQTTLKFNDKKLFEIPFYQAWPQQPVFELVDAKGKPPKVKLDKNGKPRKTKPLIIRTSGMSPQVFEVRWVRDRKSPGQIRPSFVTQ